MVTREYPTDYFNEQMEQPKQLVTETSVIPIWVPILLSIALIGSFIIALYALSLNKRGTEAHEGKT